MRLLELELDRIQAEADSYTNAPPNIVRNVWDRFVEFRKRRSDLEREVSESLHCLSLSPADTSEKFSSSTCSSPIY